MFTQLLTIFSTVGDCNPLDSANSFLGLPHWFEYLQGERDALGTCVPSFSWDNVKDLWLIALAFVDILLRVGAIVAVAFVIYGGFQYMISSGEPDKTKNAKSTILNALIGLVVTIMASTIVSFIGNSIK